MNPEVYLAVHRSNERLMTIELERRRQAAERLAPPERRPARAHRNGRRRDSISG